MDEMKCRYAFFRAQFYLRVKLDSTISRIEPLFINIFLMEDFFPFFFNIILKK